jgi:hypothetical protein
MKISEYLSVWLLEITAELIQITFKTFGKLLSVGGAVKTQRSNALACGNQILARNYQKYI